MNALAFRSTVHGNLTEPDVWVADGLDEAMLGVGTQAGHRVAVYDLDPRRRCGIPLPQCDRL